MTSTLVYAIITKGNANDIQQNFDYGKNEQTNPKLEPYLQIITRADKTDSILSNVIT